MQTIGMGESSGTHQLAATTPWTSTWPHLPPGANRCEPLFFRVFSCVTWGKSPIVPDKWTLLYFLIWCSWMLWNDFMIVWPNSCNGEGAQIDNKWSTRKVTPSGRGAGEVFGIGDISSVSFFAGSLQQLVWNELKPGCHQKPNETSRAGVNSLILFVLFQTCMLRVLPELSIITQMIAIDSCNRRRGHADIGRFGWDPCGGMALQQDMTHFIQVSGTPVEPFLQP